MNTLGTQRRPEPISCVAVSPDRQGSVEPMQASANASTPNPESRAANSRSSQLVHLLLDCIQRLTHSEQ